MKTVFNWFVKLTGWLIQKIVFNTKIYYEDKSVQSRRIKGPAIIVSNHTSVYDYAVFLFVFPMRTLRYQMAEILFSKKGLGGFLKALGGIKVERGNYNFGFVEESKRILDKGGVVGIFPESRIPKEGEITPLPFKPSAAYLALYANVPIIPVYTNGEYFHGKRARVVIGKSFMAKDLYDEGKDEKTNLLIISDCIRSKVVNLRAYINGKE